MTNPTVDAARFGSSLARLRRFQNVATSEDDLGACPDTLDFRDIGPLNTAVYPNTSTNAAPRAIGETWFGGINKTSGGTMVLNVNSGVKLSTTWKTTLTFTGAGSWAYLIGIKYNDAYRWVVLASSGVT